MQKNNYSNEHLMYLKKIKRRKRLIWICQAALLIFFFGIWELLAQLGVIDAFIVSSPSRAAATFVNLLREGSLWLHVGTTLWETLIGFSVGTVLGVLIAIMLWYSDFARRVFDPYLVVLNALPKIALGPIIIVWVGAGMGAIVTITLLISLVVTIIGVLNGYTEVDNEKIMLMQTLGANKRQIFCQLIFPASIPTMISVLKINVGMSWVGVIMGEFLVSKAGLGYLIVYGGQVFKLDLVMCGVLVLCVLAGVMYYLVALLEKWIHAKLVDKQ
ncbi:MAG: ABC transporter permease [Clostridiales bacterium]|nr:ABC transporter permease [Clostridiales bacterium]